MKLSEIKANPNNPRLIKDAKFEKLCKSIEDFPKMMELRPIIVDNNNVILGGNMRFKALKHLGHKDIPDHWVKRADDLTEEQKKEFIIKDNVGFGEHDWDLLANEWDALDLEEWGLELPKKKEEVKGEVAFSEYIGEENNYVVLLFDNDMDWLSAQTHFDLKIVTSKRANGKEWSKGVGRVLNGAEYLKKLKDGNI